MDEPAFSDRVNAWRARGAMQTLAGRRIFVASGGGASGTPLLLLHGFPSSSFDWRQTVELLGESSWLAPDLLGFGLSEKPHGRAYSIFEQADIVEELMAGSGPVLLAAHDYGTSVVTELMARDLAGELGFPVAAVLLLNGSIVVERASLTPGQRLLRSPLGPLAARLSLRPAFEREFARLFAPGQPLAAAEARDQWALWQHDGGAGNAHRLIAYIGERTRHAARWHGAVRDWPGELRLVWGMADPVSTPAVLAALRELRPAAPVTELADVGHYVQIERPDLVASALEGF
jgi:pimeloyl-ACP methyl ester carboxylesterase